MKYNCQVSLALYDAKLIFHLQLPKWNVRFDDVSFDCRNANRSMTIARDCRSASAVMAAVKRVRKFTQLYVKHQVRRIHNVVLDLPLGTRRRVARGFFTDILSRITRLASEDDLLAITNILENIEQGIYEATKLWGYGSRKLSAAFDQENKRITDVVRIVAEQRRTIRDIQRKFATYSRTEHTWLSDTLGDIVTFLDDEMWHRQEVDNLYNAVKQLMAGSIPHFILLHKTLIDALTLVQSHLDETQRHMTLSRHDFAYYYTDANFKTFRNGNILFLVIDALVVFKLLAVPFHVYEVVKFPLTTHH